MQTQDVFEKAGVDYDQWLVDNAPMNQYEGFD